MGASDGVGDDGFVLNRQEFFLSEAVFEEGFYDAFELPGLGRAGGEIFCPGQVELYECGSVCGDEFLVFGKVHNFIIGFEDGFGGGFQYGHYGFGLAEVHHVHGFILYKLYYFGVY